jgi:hypothetical protein
MATAAVARNPGSVGRKIPVEPLIRHNQGLKLGKDDFNPKKHLAFKPPTKIWSMEDINLPKDTGVSPIAVSEPFQLFTEEAIHRMRAEVLSKEVMENCQYSSNLAQCQLRGFASK